MLFAREILKTKAHCWHSVIPHAIRAYYAARRSEKLPPRAALESDLNVALSVSNSSEAGWIRNGIRRVLDQHFGNESAAPQQVSPKEQVEGTGATPPPSAAESAPVAWIARKGDTVHHYSIADGWEVQEVMHGTAARCVAVAPEAIQAAKVITTYSNLAWASGDAARIVATELLRIAER
mgnify:CR=1 FL=1